MPLEYIKTAIVTSNHFHAAIVFPKLLSIMMMTRSFWPGDHPVRLRYMVAGEVHHGFEDASAKTNSCFSLFLSI
jgi:hypothetical protein